MHLPQVGVAAGGERAREVQRGRRRVVDVDEALRVVLARLRGEVEAVDGVAPVGRERDTVARLGVARARLGVLAGETADLDHRDAGRVGEHDRHRQQHPQLVADVLGGDALERLGAVAALEQERLAPADGREPVAEVVALTGEDQRRHPAQLLDRAVAGGGVRIRGLLGSTHRMEVVETGDAHRTRVPAGFLHPRWLSSREERAVGAPPASASEWGNRNHDDVRESRGSPSFVTRAPAARRAQPGFTLARRARSVHPNKTSTSS